MKEQLLITVTCTTIGYFLLGSIFPKPPQPVYFVHAKTQTINGNWTNINFTSYPPAKGTIQSDLAFAIDHATKHFGHTNFVIDAFTPLVPRKP